MKKSVSKFWLETKDFQRNLIIKTMKEYRYNKALAARKLGISRASLDKHLGKFVKLTKKQGIQIAQEQYFNQHMEKLL